MTLDEIAYNILNLLRGGRSSNDELISLDQIKFNIQHYRAMLIRRDYARNGYVSKSIEQDLGCLHLEQVDASKCCGIELPTGCMVYKTKRRMPKTIRFNLTDAYTFIGKPDGTGTIPKIEPYELEWIPYDKYTSRLTRYYVIDEYIYIYEPHGLERINVRGVFEDPKSVAEFATCETGFCYDDQSPYPLPMDMVSAITNGLVQGELSLLTSSINDTENDKQQGQ
tara:strand:- start:492 stop:1163 length:672 start_codon:yes stop_codon:yes gene_type:complete